MAISSVESGDGVQILLNAWAYLAKQHGHDLEDVHAVISETLTKVRTQPKSGLRAGRRK
jgi:hypothetical protein